ncbi:MAG: efflux RND transporter periplasmic adaptor subunit [Cyclobacteriaceae bacterium]|nr:efflux RND transporter periplasmic adaptor subunit [Cyclobacteriaceae bacterium]
MNKTVKRLLVIVIVLAVLGWIFYPKIRPGSDAEPLAQQPMQRPILPVDMTIATPRQMENTIKITGAVQANESVALSSEISGKIEKLLFKEGQRVKKGEALLTINDDEILAQVERLKFTQKLNEEIEFRQRQLLEKQAISREEYDIALTTLNTTQSDLKERVARLSKHRIVAPFNGIIGLRQVSEGSYITPNDLIANIYSIDPIKIEFSVPGKYSNMVNPGDKILFKVEASTEVFEGKIYAVEPKIDPQTRTLQIRAICENDDEVLIPGQFANIDYILDVLPDALLIPSEAVIPEMNSHKMFICKNGMATQVQVEIGLRTEKEVQVVSGIAPGDSVITTGILQMREGLKVSAGIIK